MVPMELLHKFGFLSFLNQDQLRALALVSEEVPLKADEVIVEAGQKANWLFILMEGKAAYYCLVADSNLKGYRKEFFISEINAGEVIGISALIEPYQYTATIRSMQPGRALKIQASSLRSLCEVDVRLAYSLLKKTTHVAIERLSDTRRQLAAIRV